MKKSDRIEKKLDKLDKKTREYRIKAKAKEEDEQEKKGTNANNLLDKKGFKSWLENYLSNTKEDQNFLGIKKALFDKEVLWNKYKTLILENKYIKWKPLIRGLRSPQTEFLLSDLRDVMYGGAAGGGKSVGLLAGALMYVHISDYSALLLRRRITDLSLSGALMDLAHKWLGDTDAQFDAKNNTWKFPSGASLSFGYCSSRDDEQRYRSAQFQYIGVDELTEWNRSEFLFLFSRLRKPTSLDVPLRMRCASNPGGVGHFWVKSRYIDNTKAKKSFFIPAKFFDNPEIDQLSYDQNLMELDSVRREQIRNGNWNISPEGRKFHRGWFRIVGDYPKGFRTVRFWDKAATEPKPGKDPDYTVGAKMTLVEGVYYVIDLVRFRGRPRQNEVTIRRTAERDGKEVEIYMEQEPGSAGVNDIDNYARNVLEGYCFRSVRNTGSKELRANPVSSAAEHGNISLVQGSWINDFLDEFELFPEGPHDDIVDAVSGAFEKLTEHRPLGGDGVPSPW